MVTQVPLNCLARYMVDKRESAVEHVYGTGENEQIVQIDFSQYSGQMLRALAAQTPEQATAVDTISTWYDDRAPAMYTTDDWPLLRWNSSGIFTSRPVHNWHVEAEYRYQSSGHIFMRGRILMPNRERYCRSSCTMRGSLPSQDQILMVCAYRGRTLML